MKGRLNSIILCIVLVWFGAVALYLVWLPSNPILLVPKPPPPAEELTLGMTCLNIKSKRKCLEASPSPQHNSTDIWSSFIGIGAILSGSTSVMQILKNHPQIEIGDRHRHMKALAQHLEPAECCSDSELNFFIDENFLLRGLSYYQSFFGPRNSETKIAGEGSPSYSDHPLVPHRIRAILGPDVKLLFTIRDPVDALLSLYTLRQQDERIPVPVYFHKLLADQKVYDECVETMITSIFREPQNTSPTLFYEILGHSELNDVSKMLLDEALMICWNKMTSIRHHHERLQHYLYKENFLRWNAVFPNQIHCIWSDEFIANGLEVGNSILEFLGVDLMNSLPQSFTPLGIEMARERRKEDFKRDLGFQYKEMCDYLKKRNAGLEKLCPRRWLGTWDWCTDS